MEKVEDLAAGSCGGGSSWYHAEKLLESSSLCKVSSCERGRVGRSWY